MSGLACAHHTAEQARTITDQLVEVFLEVYAEENDEFHSEDRYREQLDAHMTGLGFELVTASDGEELAGYAYGYTLPRNAHWWDGMTTQVPPDLIAETGQRTWALCEFMVRRRWRGIGAGALLHNEVLSRRPEERATLLVEPGNPVRDIYLRWGWKPIGQQRPSWEGSPLFDCLIRPLR